MQEEQQIMRFMAYLERLCGDRGLTETEHLMRLAQLALWDEMKARRSQRQ